MPYVPTPLRLTAFVMLLAVACSPTKTGAAAEAAENEARVVIPFDFESQFDSGRYGQIVGELIWKELERRGGFIIPESMLDVRDWSARRGKHPNPATPLDEMADYVRDDFGAHVAVWGKVERVAGHREDVYDLWIKVADFSTDPPKMIVDIKARTKTVSEIPHVYVKQALDLLTGKPPEEIVRTSPEMETRWREGANLVQGDFEKGTRNPNGWDPLPPYVSRVLVPTENDDENHVVRFQFPEAVAGTTGVLYYSDFFPIEENATYRFQCRWRSTGSAVKVFIKCYDDIPSRFSDGSQSTETQRREVYRSQQNLQGPARTWNVQTEDFTPRHTQYTPRWGRVMLYAYWPAGAVDWDDITVKQIQPPPAQPNAKVRRPSLETRVTTDEIENSQ